MAENEHFERIYKCIVIRNTERNFDELQNDH